jgi:hypothetical protein
MPHSPKLTDEIKRCIADCQSCHAECLETALHVCLESGGPHTEPEHFRLMMNCAQLCATSADFMLGRSAHHERLCALCADVCEACAASCESIGGMDHCVELCRRCAESCRQMSDGLTETRAQKTSTRQTATHGAGRA